METQEQQSSKFKRIWLPIIIASTIMAVPASIKLANKITKSDLTDSSQTKTDLIDRSGAQTDISNLTFKPESRLVNGELDYGILVDFLVNNRSHPINAMRDYTGEVEVLVSLSCSEGRWTRSQVITMQHQEKRPMNFFFEEPTINVSNLEVRVTSRP